MNRTALEVTFSVRVSDSDRKRGASVIEIKKSEAREQLRFKERKRL